MSILTDDNYRYEIKFVLSQKKAEILKYRLSLVMDKDENYENGEYFIRSLYFDDIYNNLYYEKVDGLADREKYRIRFYNFDDSFIVLELKGKTKNNSYKRREIITKDEYYSIINDEYDKINVDNRKLLEEFLRVKKMKGYHASVIVDYKRIAFTYPYEDVRITFDEDVKSSKYNCDLFDKNIPLYNVLEDNSVILEVKYNTRLPRFLNDVIKTVPMNRIAVSKFQLCDERKEGLYV